MPYDGFHKGKIRASGHAGSGDAEAGGVCFLNDIAQRQKISMKYLESIVGMLNKAGLLQSRRGKDGGYRMARRPEEYPVSEILKLTEGTLAPVSCMDGEGCRPGV